MEKVFPELTNPVHYPRALRFGCGGLGAVLMTNTDYADDGVLPSCGLVSMIETLREEATLFPNANGGGRRARGGPRQ